MNEISDELLLAGMALGDEAAATSFIRRYQRRIYGLAVSILGDAKGAEDVAQEALLRVWRHCAVFDARRSSAAAWVLTITRNLAIDALRVRHSIPTDPVRLLRLASLEMETAGIEEVLDSAPEHPGLKQALAQLPPEQRRALVLAVVFGMSALDVSERESIPLGTAKTRIRSGLLKLRNSLNAEVHLR